MATRDTTLSVNSDVGPYDDAFYSEVDETALSSARVVVPLVMELLAPRSVVDVGCGRGAWLREFQSHGVSKVLGLDGDYVARDKLLIERSCFRAMNIERPHPLAEQFDLAVCLEVAEHIPARCAAGFVKFLTSLAPCVLFSAAVPGQGGTHHVNEQWPKYWESFFVDCGQVRLDPIRRHVWQDARVSWWYQQNTFVFATETLINSSRSLTVELERARNCNLTLVDEDVLLAAQGPRSMAARLPRAAVRAFGRRLRKVFGMNGN